MRPDILAEHLAITIRGVCRAVADGRRRRPGASGGARGAQPLPGPPGPPLARPDVTASMARRPQRQGRRAGPALSRRPCHRENLRRGRRGHGRRLGVVLRARNDHGAGELGRLATDGQARPRRAGRPLMAVTLDDAKTHLHITDPDAGPRSELHAHPRRSPPSPTIWGRRARACWSPIPTWSTAAPASRSPTTGNTAATTAPRMTTPPRSGGSSTCSSSAAAIPALA